MFFRYRLAPAIVLWLAGTAAAQESAPAPDAAPAAAAAPASPAAQTAAPVPTAPELTPMQAADRVYDRERNNAKKALQAIDMYFAISKSEPTNYEALWKLARACWWYAEGSSNDKTKAEYGRRGMEAADAALKLQPDGVEAHFWGASALGEYAKGIGIPRALLKGLDGDFRDHLHAADKLDPNYLNGATGRAWCRYYYELPWPKRDLDESRKACERGIARGPEWLRNYRFLAETEWDDGNKEAARTALEKCLTLPVNAGLDPADNRRMKRDCETIKKAWAK